MNKFNSPNHGYGKRKHWGDIAHPKTSYETYLEDELRKATFRIKELEATLVVTPSE